MAVAYDRCEVSWTAGHIWLAFPFLGYFFDNRKGCGGRSPPHINIHKIQSFPPILKDFSFVQLSSCPANFTLVAYAGGWGLGGGGSTPEPEKIVVEK